MELFWLRSVFCLTHGQRSMDLSGLASHHCHQGLHDMTNLSEVILPQLPYLRRFARSLTGRQESGDAYVAAILEAIVADPAGFPSDMPPRSALYRMFLANWNSVPVNTSSASSGLTAHLLSADRRLEAITPMPRQAFLLVAMEGFTKSESAIVLNVPETEVENLINTAAREMAEQVATTVLIIEDEPLIALDLEGVVTSIGHKVTRIARTRREAVAAFTAKRPGLVLADIQLADGSSGLDAVNDILDQVDMPVIFITAYPEQVLTGLRPEPTFLIPKPFQHETVKAVISQALFFDLKATNRHPTGSN
jgi:DNA-directed RNA polymerase specialized sigma24 family protein/CheY-like chemotaxis protein